MYAYETKKMTSQDVLCTRTVKHKLHIKGGCLKLSNYKSISSSLYNIRIMYVSIIIVFLHSNIYLDFCVFLV